MIGPLATLLIAVVIVVGGILVLRLHAFLALLLAALTVAVLTPRSTLQRYADEQVAAGKWTATAADDFVRSPAPARVATGFGNTCRSIGILIALAAVIGKCLLDSGAADRIVRSCLRMVGEPRAALSFVASGFVLGIPVFFDTVFYLMIPLGKALRLRTGGHYVLYILSIVAGATMAHSLVPPTPGPLLVANQLNIDLTLMIAAGCGVGLVSSLSGYAFAWAIDRTMDVPLRESPDFSLADLRALADRPDRDLPPLWLSLLPILLPVLLIALGTAWRTWQPHASSMSDASWQAYCDGWITTVGDKNMALLIAACIAMATAAWIRRSTPKELATSVQGALAGGGVIILITAAGGAFGTTVRQCGIADLIARQTGDLPGLVLLPVAFLVTTLVRTAQGSATVAMITAVSILEHMATPDLPFHPVYLALAIGCGSKPIAWMNDSGFWVICKMSGMTEWEGLRTVSPMSVIMGVSGLAATVLAAWLWPLV